MNTCISTLLVLFYIKLCCSTQIPCNNLFTSQYVQTYKEELGPNFYENIPPLQTQSMGQRVRTGLASPDLISWNSEVANLLGLCSDEFETDLNYPEYLCGNLEITKAGHPFGMIYAGHQFGGFTPQLGDGRAAMLGEIVGANGTVFGLHAKGTGPNPFSRGGDGRAVLRSSIREYLISEAMHYLNIPTTRALSLVGSETKVYRESLETAAVVVRVAPVSAFIRFGSFEVFSSRNQKNNVKKLADYIIKHSFSHLDSLPNKYESLLLEISSKTAKMIAKWMTVGFVHGVMNTDNMSILSWTIDYGPFAFMDSYDPNFSPNHSDDEGRYAYSQQPFVARWNIEKLVDAFESILDDKISTLKSVSDNFDSIYETSYSKLMRAKLGLITSSHDDKFLWEDLLYILYRYNVDYTNFFRKLGNFIIVNNNRTLENSVFDNVLLLNQFFKSNEAQNQFNNWSTKYTRRLISENNINNSERKKRMNSVNPKYILRTYMLQQVIDNAKKGDYEEITTLLNLIKHPFDEQPEMEHYALEPPFWAQQISLSCSS